MSNIYQFHSQERSYDEASTWIARLDRQLSPAEEQELKRWLAQHPGNAELLCKMADLWDRADALARLAELFPRPPKPKTPWLLPSLAASVVIASLLGLAMLLQPDIFRHPDAALALMDSRYETALGERSNINLPDGTRVTLNTNSVLRITYTEVHRLLILDRGELHVQVAHDQNRPLSVYAEGKIVQAVGTAFSVRINHNKAVKLLVTDGKVLVAAEKHAQQAQQETEPQRITQPTLAVTKGETVLLGEQISPVEKVQVEDMEAQLSWRQGNLVFRGETLHQAIEEISRYTAVNFEFADDDIRELRIAGLFKAGDIHGLLSALNKNFGLHYQRKAENIILLSKPAEDPTTPTAL